MGDTMAETAPLRATEDEPTSQVKRRPVDASGVLREARMRGMVEQHFDFIWRTLRRLGVGEADADDATQEVFLVASRKLDEVAVTKERSFLFGTALRVASTHRRTSSRRRESPGGSLDDRTAQGLGPDDMTERHRARRLLDEVLNELDLDVRGVFVLFELEELTAPQIAELLGIPVGTVASRLRRAREVFRAALNARLEPKTEGRGSDTERPVALGTEIEPDAQRGELP
jgi:RNA polymerase sigma-70 factor (ECF subfamily)